MISKEEIQNLAELARLELGEGEIAGLQKDISNILDYIGQIAAVSGEAQVPIPLVRNVMREDTPHEGDLLQDKQEALRYAFPKREGDYVVVRKILQKDE